MVVRRFMVLVEENSDQCRDGKPQEALQQKKHEAPEPKFFDPVLLHRLRLAQPNFVLVNLNHASGQE